MRPLVGFAGMSGFALLLVMPLPAQERGGRQPAGDAGRSVSSASGRPSVTATTTAATNTSVTRTHNVGSNNYSAPVASSGSAVSDSPNLSRTSFNSAGRYYDSLNFFYWVHNNYYLDGYYFSRFYRNTEPLITPQLARLTMSQPLSLSTRLLASIDQLDAMMRDQQAGKRVGKAEIAAKTEEIRNLAKQIRQDQSILFFDQRREKNLLKGTEYEDLGPEAIAQMREMALDLNRQLRTLYEQKSTATVSVESLAAPSFSSLSKGIERLSKAVSQSARKGS